MHKSGWLAVALTTLMVSVSIAAAVSANSVVGVKQGDWIKYAVTVTGNVPPEDNITWA